MEMAATPFAKVGTDGAFARMAKGRIAHVVCQTSSTDNGAKACDLGVAQMGVTHDEFAAHIGAKGTTYAADFEAVGETIVHKDASRERKDLRLVLHTAEGCGEYEPIIVALKLCASLFEWLGLVFLAEALGGNEGLPIHSS